MTGRSALASDLSDELRTRAAQAVERAEEVRDRAPELARELRPKVRRTEIRALSLFQTLVDVLLLLPRIAVRVLGVLADSIDEVVDRGRGLAERGREAADALPPARATVRRQRLRTAMWVGAGFGAGFVTGWLVAQRQSDESVRASEAMDLPVEGASTDGESARPAAVPD